MGQYDFLKAGGETGTLIREKDWSVHPLGPVSGWPQELKTTLGILLHSGFPMSLYWGPSFFCFYNDAFRRGLYNQEKHPALLGAPCCEGWAECWPSLHATFEKVLAGESFWHEDTAVPFFSWPQRPTFGAFSFSPVTDKSGKPAGVFLTCYETTEKVRVQNKNISDNDQLHFFLESAELGTWELNPHTGQVSANRRTREWYGLPAEGDISFSMVMNAILPRDRDRVESCIQNAIHLETQGKYEIIYRIRSASHGKVRIVKAKGRAFFSEGPVADRFQGTVEDITSEMSAQESLRESERKFRKLMDSSLVAMAVLTGKDYCITSVNAAMLGLWGKEEPEVMERPLFSVIDDDGRALLDSVCRTGERLMVSERKSSVMRQGNKTTAWLDLALEPMKDAAGKVTALIVMASDVTDKINLRLALTDRENSLKTERLKASIEAQEKERELIANELHDNVNQLLASTKLYIGMIEGRDEQAKTFKSTSSEYIDRCMTEIRNISHGLNPATLHFVGLSRSIRDMIAHIDEASTVRFRFAERRNAKTSEEHRDVELAIFRITQIQVANILKHSRAHSAKVTVLYCHDFVELTISDDGVGFDPARSKKGLGLLNILNRAELLQGKVILSSEPGKGCLLKVRIPWSARLHPLPADLAFSAH